jgi:hypothetical protein
LVVSRSALLFFVVEPFSFSFFSILLPTLQQQCIDEICTNSPKDDAIRLCWIQRDILLIVVYCKVVHTHKITKKGFQGVCVCARAQVQWPAEGGPTEKFSIKHRRFTKM